MSEKKIFMMLIAVVAIGIFALPSTMCVFGGQHAWYDLGDTENTVPCAKCHADISEELYMSEVHSTFDSDNPNEVCHTCHRANKDRTYAKGGGPGKVTPGKQVHSASTIACMACHESGAKVHGDNQGPFAGGFAQPRGSPYKYTSSASNGYHEAHNAYIQGALNNDMMEDSNEACIACHASVAMDIDWSRAYAMQSKSVANQLGEWTVKQFKGEGSFEVTTYGSSDGEVWGVTDPEIDIEIEPPEFDLEHELEQWGG
ncbi:MAG TPA: hypothetical protein EYP28_06555 [Methanophagales archaeon]|nr:hypothetical protein [Methanophagales archaeon]